jgi:predicted GIY-YIG superfamily endonuclease
MHYVYLLRSISHPEQTYIGYTTNLKHRLEQHNSSNTYYTSDHKPWQLVTYIAFDSEEKAVNFEKYLKGGSGYAFAQKRLW